MDGFVCRSNPSFSLVCVCVVVAPRCLLFYYIHILYIFSMIHNMHIIIMDVVVTQHDVCTPDYYI